MTPLRAVEPTAGDLSMLMTAAAIGRDDVAFTTLVRSCDPPLRRLAMALVGVRQGDDLMFDVWRAALARWPPAAAESSSVLVWLAGIVVELARPAGLPLRLEPLSPNEADGRFFPPHHRHAGHWVVSPAPWTREVTSAVAMAAARTALAEIPSVLVRAVTMLRDVDGFTLPDVAAILDIDEATVRRALHEGRLVVRAALDLVLRPA